MSTVTDRTTKRALLKCESLESNTISVYCTPVEYLALCKHFNYYPSDRDFYAKRVKSGICNQCWHYVQR